MNEAGVHTIWKLNYLVFNKVLHARELIGSPVVDVCAQTFLLTQSDVEVVSFPITNKPTNQVPKETGSVCCEFRGWGNKKKSYFKNDAFQSRVF